jgi:aspartyl protease family protein
LGTKTLYNVQASVVHNLSAPLLMGQSALSKFGTVTIDNANGTITHAD